ncbi:hypothetical protein MLD38_010964 [Melastoma candidum]|uniref:Uncharacterized protein n=1 Tax=Melastoma candidum TaxID=119954 RepID=A0ACB9R4M2_9MYRT|nr:hypothetical protein MLD38_010964 [Melastoma candidum]
MQGGDWVLHNVSCPMFLALARIPPIPGLLCSCPSYWSPLYPELASSLSSVAPSLSVRNCSQNRSFTLAFPPAGPVVFLCGSGNDEVACFSACVLFPRTTKSDSLMLESGCIPGSLPISGTVACRLLLTYSEDEARLKFSWHET